MGDKVEELINKRTSESLTVVKGQQSYDVITAKNVYKSFFSYRFGNLS